jgi:predicted DNA-binding protein YlxM (UPF0122 family)
MEKILEQSLLYDFYGELLTEHQKFIYEDYVLNDLSLSEIAMEQGISRQGVHDIIKRCDKVLKEYEAKLHLIEKFLTIKEEISRLKELISNYENTDEIKLLKQIEEIADHILEEA